MDIKQLKDQLTKCEECKSILPFNPNPIFQFSEKSKILIAGQAPGRITHEKGRPFDDPSGNRLLEWLGVTREQFYNEDKFAIVPMSFCFPGSAKGGDLPPIRKCAEIWRRQVLDQLSNVSLTLLIGKYAIDWHLNNKLSLTDNIKEWLKSPSSTIPLPHPSPRNNIWLTKNQWFKNDMLPELKLMVQKTL